MIEHEPGCDAHLRDEECCCGMFPIPDFAEWIQRGVRVRVLEGYYKGWVGSVTQRIEPHYTPMGAVVLLDKSPDGEPVFLSLNHNEIEPILKVMK